MQIFKDFLIMLTVIFTFLFLGAMITAYITKTTCIRYGEITNKKVEWMFMSTCIVLNEDNEWEKLEL